MRVSASINNDIIVGKYWWTVCRKYMSSTHIDPVVTIRRTKISYDINPCDFRRNFASICWYNMFRGYILRYLISSDLLSRSVGWVAHFKNNTCYGERSYTSINPYNFIVFHRRIYEAIL